MLKGKSLGWLNLDILYISEFQPLSIHDSSGDKKYGAATTLPDKQIALYAHQLIFEHPVSKEEVCVESPPPNYWPMR